MKKVVLMILLTFFTAISLSSCREDKSAKEKVEDGIEEVGDGLEEGAEEVGDAVEDGAEEVEEEVEDAVDDSGN